MAASNLVGISFAKFQGQLEIFKLLDKNANAQKVWELHERMLSTALEVIDLQKEENAQLRARIAELEALPPVQARAGVAMENERKEARTAMPHHPVANGAAVQYYIKNNDLVEVLKGAISIETMDTVLDRSKAQFEEFASNIPIFFVKSSPDEIENVNSVLDSERLLDPLVEKTGQVLRLLTTQIDNMTLAQKNKAEDIIQNFKISLGHFSLLQRLKDNDYHPSPTYKKLYLNQSFRAITKMYKIAEL